MKSTARTYVERETAASVEQLAEVRVAGQRALAPRPLEDAVMLEERFLLEVHVRLQIPVDRWPRMPVRGSSWPGTIA